MAQPKGFAIEGKEHMGCRLKKFIYGLKQASRQWYLMFDEVIKKFGYVKNQMDNCVYITIKESMCYHPRTLCGWHPIGKQQ
jgi:hypothetical protein